MNHLFALLFLIGWVGSCSRQSFQPISICELSRDYPAYRDKVIAVRGVYYQGLRGNCAQKCADGPWPSFIDLIGARTTSDSVWSSAEGAQHRAEEAAKQGKRIEIWVTAIGRLRTEAKHSPLGPCDRIGSRMMSYGHLGALPAQLEVTQFVDIEVKEAPGSPFDYSRLYRGAF